MAQVFNIGGGQPLELDDQAWSNLQTKIQSGMTPEEALTNLKTELASKFGDTVRGRKDWWDAFNSANIFGGLRIGYNPETSYDWFTGGLGDTAILARLKENPEPITYKAGSLQEGQTPVQLSGPTQPTQPVAQPTQPVAQPTQPAQNQGGYINVNGAFFQQTANGLALVNDQNTLNQLKSGQIPSSSQSSLGSQTVGGMTNQPQQGYINANGAYFQQTANGLALVNDPNILRQLQSGAIPSTQQGLGSQQLTGMTAPSLIPEEARSATPEQGLQYVAQVMPELADNIMSSIGYSGSPEQFDSQYSTMAQSNPVQFVQDLYGKMLEQSGLPQIKTQYEEFIKKQEDLTNQMNDEILEINDNPWLVEGVRQRQIRKVQEKYAGRIDSATNSAKYLQSLYADGLTEARFMAQQALNIYNDQVDFEQQLYRDALQRQEDRIDAQMKMGADMEMVLLKESFKTTPSGGGTVTVSSKAVTELKEALNASKFEGPEADGKYADPTLYLLNYESFLADGGSAAEFFRLFPPATYINPKNTWLPDEILRFVKKDTSSSGMTDEEFINELRR